MKPDVRPRTDPMEAELRDWARSRDRGSVPERLRIRVAHVADEPARRPAWGRVRMIQAAAAAAVLGLLLIAGLVLRTGPAETSAASGGPTVSGSPTASVLASPASSASLDFNALINGTWPPTPNVTGARVDDATVNAVAWTLIAVGLGLAGLTALVTLMGVRPIRPAYSRRRRVATWTMRILALGVASSLIIQGGNLIQVAESAPIEYGSFLGIGLHPLGYSYSSGANDAFEAYVPGSTDSFIVSIANESDSTVTVLTFDEARFRELNPEASLFIESMDVGLPPGLTPYGIWPMNEPFHEFDMPGHSQGLILGLHLKLKACSGSVAAGPTASPLSPADGNFQPQAGTAAISVLPFRYVENGIEREADVAMRTHIVFVFGNYPAGCDG